MRCKFFISWNNFKNRCCTGAQATQVQSSCASPGHVSALPSEEPGFGPASVVPDPLARPDLGVVSVGSPHCGVTGRGTRSDLRTSPVRADPHQILWRPTTRSPQHAVSPRHGLARQSWASRACRRTTGLADCARWLSGVVYSTFPCLFPLNMGTAAVAKLVRCSPCRCPPRLDHFGAARRIMLCSSLAAPDPFATPHFPKSHAQRLTCCKLQF